MLELWGNERCRPWLNTPPILERNLIIIDSAGKPYGHAKAWTPNARFLRDSARVVSSLQAASMGSRGFSEESIFNNW